MKEVVEELFWVRGSARKTKFHSNVKFDDAIFEQTGIFRQASQTSYEFRSYTFPSATGSMPEEPFTALVEMSTMHDRLTSEERISSLVLEEGILRRLKGKESELERTCRKNAELEKRLKQLSVASQIWQNVANNNENVANTLRVNLDQCLKLSNPAKMEKAWGMGAGRKLEKHIGIKAKQPIFVIQKCARVQLIKNGKKIVVFVPNDGCLIEENDQILIAGFGLNSIEH
ncbi:hypothetical protein SUGI_0462160 [Cryptomeria japonica]|nr:hypothetical protein SUGI_0462160 [Cryptomeria japonica]